MDFINIIGTFFDNSIEHVVALAHQIKDLRLNKNQQEINEDLYDQIRIAKETKDKCKGYYDNYHSLNLNVPVPQIGDWAIVKSLDDNKWYIKDGNIISAANGHCFSIVNYTRLGAKDCKKPVIEAIFMHILKRIKMMGF